VGWREVKELQALVTRPRQEAESLAVALASRGVGALIEPLMDIHFRAPHGFDLGGVQAVLCTSANGVRALALATNDRAVPLFAVGDATASRARSEGFISVESAAGDVGDLVRLAAARLKPEQGRLLHVAGDTVAGNLVEALRERGFMIERGVLYEAQPVAALSAKAVSALRGGDIHFALFFSPRTATIFARLANTAQVAKCCGRVAALSISPAADAALANLPWRDRHIAERPNQAALLDMLDRVLCQARRV
jgi:uroporphyrinogen-III synthase